MHAAVQGKFLHKQERLILSVEPDFHGNATCLRREGFESDRLYSMTIEPRADFVHGIAEVIP
jgi:hypothetical protein